MEEELQEIPETQSSKSRLFIIVAFVSMILILGGALTVLQIKENRILAEKISQNTKAKTEALYALGDFTSLPNSNSLDIAEYKEALDLMAAAELSEKDKNFDESKKLFINSLKKFKSATYKLKKHNELHTALNDIENALIVFDSMGPAFPKYKESELEKIYQQIKSTKELIGKLAIDESAKSIESVHANFSSLEKNLQAKTTKLEKDWETVKKEDTKESYQVFISSYPNSEFIKEAQQRVSEIIQKEEELRIAAEEAQKKKEEELRKEQEIIAARKAQLEKEMKQKRELEQVVTLNFDDGSSYTGQLNLEKKPHGEGTYTYTNSNVYTGHFKDGKYHGEGQYEFYTGITFKGKFEEGKRIGEGLITWKNGDKFHGFWKDGKLYGKAIFVPAKGFKKNLMFYEGEDIGREGVEAYFKKKALLKDRFEKNRMSSSESRAYQFIKRFNDGIKALREENPTVLFPDLPVYIDKHDSYKAGRMTSRNAEKHESLLKNIFFEQKRYLMVTKQSLEKDEVGEMESAEFGGFTIMTANLGVILDNSGSMTQYLEKLRNKIKKKFKKSAFIEVLGCSLTPTLDEPINQELAERSTIAAIKFLVDYKGADTIYWFSDLNDPQSPAALKELQEFLYKNMVTLYLSSVGHKPSKELKEILEESGGKVLRF